jgi:hypothetical protein
LPRVLVSLLLLTSLDGLAHAEPPTEDAIPVAPMDDGRAVHAVLEARPFSLREGSLTYDWMAGAPAIEAGRLVVVEVDPTYLVPRQVKAPVLYAGPVPVDVLQRDREAGCVVGVIPSGIDPAHEPFYFGSWELPERVDARRGAAERDAALAIGLRPRPPAEVATWTLTPLDAHDPADLATTARAALASCTQSIRSHGGPDRVTIPFDSTPSPSKR